MVHGKHIISSVDSHDTRTAFDERQAVESKLGNNHRGRSMINFSKATFAVKLVGFQYRLAVRDERAYYWIILSDSFEGLIVDHAAAAAAGERYAFIKNIHESSIQSTLTRLSRARNRRYG